VIAANDIPDAELVRQAKAGSLAALEALASRHEQPVYALAMRLLRNPHDAEDVTQQTFLAVLEDLGGFREESSFATWIHRIATHAALKIIRRRKGWETTPLAGEVGGEETYASVPHPEFIAEWRENPEQLAQRSETRQLIEEAIAQLDEKHRLVFLLRDVEGMSIEETAQELGLSVANVKVRLLRARLQLREQLTQHFGDPARRKQPHDHQHAKAREDNL
jgi:RNA polymerase sigma-70 factor, ECF subfamily